jgi:hypothetical protein
MLMLLYDLQKIYKNEQRQLRSVHYTCILYPVWHLYSNILYPEYNSST